MSKNEKSQLFFSSSQLRREDEGRRVREQGEERPSPQIGCGEQFLEGDEHLRIEQPIKIFQAPYVSPGAQVVSGIFQLRKTITVPNFSLLRARQIKCQWASRDTKRHHLLQKSSSRSDCRRV